MLKTNKYVVYMKKIIIILAVFLLPCACGINKSYYPTVDTGKIAVMRETDPHRRNETIILDKRYYVSPEDSENEIYFHAADKAQTKAAFCNFGDKGEVTLYEMESEMDFPVYADNFKRVIFVEEINETAFLNYYLNYNNYNFYVRSKSEKDACEVKFEDDFINDLLKKYSNGTGDEFDADKAKEIRLVAVSKDGLVESEENIVFYEKDGEYYRQNAEGFATKLTETENEKIKIALRKKEVTT